MANADGQRHPNATLPDTWCAAWSRNQDGNPYSSVDCYTHTIPNSQRHAGAAIANAYTNMDTLTGCAGPQPEPGGGG